MRLPTIRVAADIVRIDPGMRFGGSSISANESAPARQWREERHVAASVATALNRRSARCLGRTGTAAEQVIRYAPKRTRTSTH
jgi:hypothetical protein